MKARNISVTFNVDVYDSRPWFQVPKSIAGLLALRSGDAIAVSVGTPEGEPLYHGLAKLDFHAKSCKAHIGKRLKKGDEIRVTAFHPPAGTVRDR